MSLMLYKKFQDNLNNLLDKIIPSSISLAVSGGVDSVALLLLMDIWAKENRVEIIVFTVNHNIRVEAKIETQYVVELCKQLDYSCLILDWDPHANFANLSARAREGRYKLMTYACHKYGVLNLLTAHHQDDYVENFIIRKKRKSGILGLSSSNINFYNNIKIIRPLFNIQKQELIDFLQNKNIKWIDDLSNFSSKYLRNRIRNELETKEKSFKKKILLKQNEINQEAKLLSKILIEAIAESTIIYSYGFARINLEILAKYSFTQQLYLINYILAIISGNIKTPRADSTIKLLKIIQLNNDFTKTLHGCIIKKINIFLLIFREFGKTIPESVELKNQILWDQRYFYEGKTLLPGAYITNLNMSDYKEIKNKINLEKLKTLSFNNHKAILFTLPTIKKLEKIIALPHISFYNYNELNEHDMKFSYKPAFTSRFIHFF